MSKRKVLSIVTAATKDRVIITDEAIDHIIETHFNGIPKNIILETVEQVLRDPSEVYKDKKDVHEYDFFYRLDNGAFIVVVVKIIHDGNFVSSMYTTGKKHRNKHKGFKKVKI